MTVGETEVRDGELLTKLERAGDAHTAPLARESGGSCRPKVPCKELAESHIPWANARKRRQGEGHEVGPFRSV